MPISETVLVIMSLLAIAIIAAGLCRNLPVPFTVLLVVIGIGLGSLADIWQPLAPLQSFRLSPEIVFFIFLPALIFESGFNLNARQLLRDLAPVLMLAIPALLISTFLIGAGLNLFIGMAPVTALLFGALISATDPVAVVALFRELGAPQRLTVLVEGESLLNDATAIVLFAILLGISVEGGEHDWTLFGAAVLDFLRIFLGGALVGAVLGLVVSELLYRLKSGLSAILTLSLALAYGSFILAEHVWHVSGVMAAVSAALALGIYGVARLHQEATDSLGETWEFLALIANSLLFLLVGLSIHPAALASRLDLIVLVVILVMAARAATLYSLVPLTTRFFALPKISRGEQHIMWWGGLKGGLAIAIVLSIPEDFPGRPLLLDLTLGVVLFTLLINAPTIRPLMRWLGLDRMTREDRAELKQGILEAHHQVEQSIGEMHNSGVISKAGVHRFRRDLAAVLETGTTEIAEGEATRDVYLFALRIEQVELARLYDLNLITQYSYIDLRNLLQRDRDRSRREDPGAAARPNREKSLFLRLENTLLRRLRERDWASGFLSRYQNLRLSQRLERTIAGILMADAVLRALQAHAEFPAGACAPIQDTYTDRLQRRRQRLETIRREFPDFYRRYESRLFSRVALSSALQNTGQAHHNGTVGAKAYAHIAERIHEALEALPPISVPLPQPKPEELIQMVPLFSGLSVNALGALARHARQVTFLTRDEIIGEGEKGDALYILIRGEVGVFHSAPQGGETRLSCLTEGAFFGETALLGDPLRTATVRAETPVTLLRLTRKDILRLAGQHPEVRQRLVEASKERRKSPEQES